MINSILAGGLAAFFSFYLNTKALKLDKLAIVYVAPFIEEVMKTYFALYLNSSVIFSHVIFGCIEGLYDIIKSKSSNRYLAGVAALVSHSIFGIITENMIKSYQVPLKAIITSCLVHSIFNLVVLWYSGQL